MRAPRICFSLLFWLIGLQLAAPAKTTEAVEVAVVRYDQARPPGGSADAWLEVTVALAVAPPAGSPGRAVSRVRVSLQLGWELPAAAGGARRTDYYRAEAECVALDAGRSEIRFYLPPELVKRDQLHGAPKFWTVDLAVAGRALPAARPASSPNLVEGPARRAFQAAAGNAAPANDGLLQPQYLTPFALAYPRSTPSFVRREAGFPGAARDSP